MSTTIESRDRMIDILSLSYLGDLLREQLGDDAENYTWPDDFEKAVADIGFSGLVMRGDTSPYDLIVIGDGLSRVKANSYNAGVYQSPYYRSARFINVKLIPGSAFINQVDLKDVIFQTGIEKIGRSSFLGTGITEAILPETVTVIEQESFRSCSNLETFVADGISKLEMSNYPIFAGDGALKRVSLKKLIFQSGGSGNYGAFYNCTSLELVELGSVGYPLQAISSGAFSSCTQSGLQIVIHTDAKNLSAVLANVRNGATNATIIIKAAADMEYNGTTYQAGDTVLTSTT